MVSRNLTCLVMQVIDESDRLLRQSYQEWLPKVLSAFKDGSIHGVATGSELNLQPRLVKIIVSATLTQDPAKLERLDLHYPRYITFATAEQR